LGFIFGLVIEEFDGGDKSKIELLGSFRPYEARGALETRQNVLFFLRLPEEIEIDAGVPEIPADFGSRQRNRADARIADLFAQ
jgi:hypothetical protein